MSRKRCRRRAVLPLPPKGLRPMLNRGQRLDLEVIHLQTLDDIAHGRATLDTLLDWAGAVLTWGKAAHLTGQLVDEMTEQHLLWMRLWERHQSTGRVVFTGPEYQLAKRGIEAMNTLAYSVDQAVATQAAAWSEARLNATFAGRQTATTTP